MFRHSSLCLGAKFIDIDSPGALVPKREIVRQTPELLAPLTSLEFLENSSILLTSDQYCQIASDLHSLSKIEQALPQAADVDGSEFLFVAEKPMAQMEVGDADALIRWAGAIGDAEFCLLEPTLPDGSLFPSAQAMLLQLAKDKAPAKSVEHYPTVDSQQKRFEALGWPDARARSWWHAWSDPLCMSPKQRKALDKVEDFDDWEEFVHFASHHCVLHARTAALLPEPPSQDSLTEETGLPGFPTKTVDVTFSPSITTKSVSPRRSGAPMVLQTILGQNVVANMFGQGPDGQLRSCDLYSNSNDPEAASGIVLPQGGPGARSCFTLTDLGDSGYLLAGGKGSHAAPFSDCWIFKKDTHQWVETHSLPLPLFRHSVERLGNSKLVLLAGGRLDFTTAHSNFLVFHPSLGWVRCSVKGTLQPPALYGCFLSCTGPIQRNPSAFRGILAGGMTTDGVVFDETLEWVLDVSNITEPAITFEPITSRWPTQLLARYGAVSARAGDWVVVAGGVGTTGTLPASQEIVRFRACGERSEAYECLDFVHRLGPEARRPFFTGASIVALNSSEVAIIGGGTPCFSTESGWSRGLYSFHIQEPSVSDESTRKEAVWKYSRTLTVTNETPVTPHEIHSQRLSSNTAIPRMELKSAEHFESILRNGKPVVFENLKLGSCLTKWSLAYLADRVGPERKVNKLCRSVVHGKQGVASGSPANFLLLYQSHQVVVHESTDQAMDFLAKNFRYKTQTFQEFAGDVDDGKKLYLRALSADKPSGAPSILDVDFPIIASDFVLPPQLAFVNDKLFSSVLRISGPVNMWLHYDVSGVNPSVNQCAVLENVLVCVCVCECKRNASSVSLCGYMYKNSIASLTRTQ